MKKVSNFVARLFWALELVLWFLWQLWLSNWQVMKLALSRHPQPTPGVIEFPLSLKTDLGITFLANMITLTPGTVSIDVTEKKRSGDPTDATARFLLVYVLFLKDAAAATSEIKDGFEARIKRVFES